jgi:cell division initiation protein
VVDYGQVMGSEAGDSKRRGREVKITPLDIRRKEFKRSMRGYSDEEVDVFLDEVADEFERLYRENGEMGERLTTLEEQIAGYMTIKETLEKTLVSAQMQSDEMRANARKEAELTLRDAEIKSRQIVNDSYGEIQRVQQSLIQLKHLEEDFRFKFRSLLEAHLKLVEEAPIAVAAPEASFIPVPEIPLVAPPEATFVEAPVARNLHEAAAPEVIAAAETAAASEDTEPAEAPLQETAPAPVEPPVEVGPIPGVAAQLEAVALTTSDNEAATEEIIAPSLREALDSLRLEPAHAPSAEPVAEPATGAMAAELEEPGSAPADADEPPIGGFFFGQSADDGGEDFFVLGREKKGQDRDFEW